MPPPKPVAPPPPPPISAAPLPAAPPLTADLPHVPPSSPTAAVGNREFDWESLVGIKLFSWIAAIALVLAGVFFLRYSIEHGWLGAGVRMAIGISVGIGLLMVCELRVARNYAVTANAMDGAGIAILFSTIAPPIPCGAFSRPARHVSPAGADRGGGGAALDPARLCSSSPCWGSLAVSRLRRCSRPGKTIRSVSSVTCCCSTSA